MYCLFHVHISSQKGDFWGGLESLKSKSKDTDITTPDIAIIDNLLNNMFNTFIVCLK